MATVLDLSPLDPQVRRLALKSMRNYCKYLIEFLELPVLTSRDEIIASMRIYGLEHLQDALARGKGVILASAHFGTIEVGGLRLADFTDFHAVYDSFRPPYLDQLIQRKRREKGINLIPVKDVRRMLHVLRCGGTVTLLYDKPLGVANGVRVRFFGKETAIPAGPAVLALKTDASLLPVYMFRNPDKTFECRIFPPVSWARSGQRELDIQSIMQKLMDTLQAVVRSRPDQWYMFRDMWPDDRGSRLSGAPEVITGQALLCHATQFCTPLSAWRPSSWRGSPSASCTLRLLWPDWLLTMWCPLLEEEFVPTWRT
jgi:KDO2-lipid IV(A) lauroyltransferase